MGGGTRPISVAVCLPVKGLSPRGRGNLTPLICASPFGVYPRVGGGTTPSRVVASWKEGLSPRGRGNRKACKQTHLLFRSIPAWAGEPLTSRAIPRATRVYPRVGGGTRSFHSFGWPFLGLSPRGRGNRHVQHGRDGLVGSIPAWAGEPAQNGSRAGSHAVYPRVGGGTGQRLAEAHKYVGLSPRGRGNLLVVVEGPFGVGSIPAWAGEPKLRHTARASFAVYPRVGGGTATSIYHPMSGHGLSPRGRGNHQSYGVGGHSYGSIPAWAGEPLPGRCRPSNITVYPRVGGGTSPARRKVKLCLGLSPRGRGNLGAGHDILG